MYKHAKNIQYLKVSFFQYVLDIEVEFLYLKILSLHVK